MYNDFKAGERIVSSLAFLKVAMYKVEALSYLLDEFHNALNNDVDLSVKKLAERMSYINPSWVA